MKISASIYSSSNKNLEENIRILDELNIDMIHIDFNDKKSDEEKIFSDIKRIKSLSSIPIDLHIISEKDLTTSQHHINGFSEVYLLSLQDIYPEAV